MKIVTKVNKLLKSNPKRIFEWLLLAISLIFVFYIAYSGIEGLRDRANELGKDGNFEWVQSVMTYSIYKTLTYISLILISYYLIDKKLK